MVHSAQNTVGFCDRQLTCYLHSEDHFYVEGHGRVQLDQILHYANESDFELFLYYSQINSNKNSFSIEFTITNIS